jgi:hypothetical protein
LAASAIGAVVLVLAGGCGGSSSAGQSPAPAGGQNATLTSQQICQRLSLSALGQITGDTWARTVPQQPPVRECEVDGSDGVAQIFAAIEAPPAGTNPSTARSLSRSIFQSDTRSAGWVTVGGLADEAAFQSSTSALEVLRGVTIYRIQLLSSKLSQGPQVLESDKKILALIT